MSILLESLDEACVSGEVASADPDLFSVSDSPGGKRKDEHDRLCSGASTLAGSPVCPHHRVRYRRSGAQKVRATFYANRPPCQVSHKGTIRSFAS